MKTNLILICLLLTFVGCEAKDEESVATPTVTDAESSDSFAMEASHPDANIKWVVRTFEDLKQCTDTEWLNMTIFCTLGKSADSAEDFIWIGNKYMPERFKTETLTNGKVVIE